jgi:hypothetical protein
VTGDVYFGRNVTLRGTVIVVANEGQRIDIPDGCILENRLLSGNLTMTVRVSPQYWAVPNDRFFFPGSVISGLISGSPTLLPLYYSHNTLLSPHFTLCTFLFPSPLFLDSMLPAPPGSCHTTFLVDIRAHVPTYTHTKDIVFSSNLRWHNHTWTIFPLFLV